MASLGPSSFGMLNNILATTGGLITNQLGGGVPGAGAIASTEGALATQPNFAMAGGGGFYSSPTGAATRQGITTGQFAPLGQATAAETIRKQQLADLLSKTGVAQAGDWASQQNLQTGQNALALQGTQGWQSLISSILPQLGLAGPYSGTLGNLGGALTGILSRVL